MSFRQDFYVRKIETNFDLDAPGIYEWRLHGIGTYVGKATKLSSRIRAYPNNVRRLISGLPWHGNPSKSYRPIHIALRDAHDRQVNVIVSVIENCELDLLAERERFWIEKRRQEMATLGLQLFNAA